MKKYFFILAAAAALAACAKNEVTPVLSQENTEIAYNVAPKTKTTTDFLTTNVFASWAYYLPNDKNWDANLTEAQPYIDNSKVSYQTDGSDTWKETGKTYYWPKGGKLTFFAYSLNKENLTLKAENSLSHVAIAKEADCYGITALIDLDENPNTDFLVADIAKDQFQNTNKAHSRVGVPTLFKHKFSRVEFQVKKSANYADKEFKLNSIKFNKLSHAATYAQSQDADKTGTKDGVNEEYILASGTRTTQVYTETALNITSTDYVAVPKANEKRYIYIPQDFKGVTDVNAIATIEVNYTVTTTVGANKVDDACTATINVKDYFDSWEMGKKYIFKLDFTLDEIKWDPAVENWVDVNSTDITIQ